MNNGLKDDHTNFRSRKICLTFLIEKIGPDHSKQDFKARHQNGVHYDTEQKITRSSREWEDVSWDRKSLTFPFCCLNRNSKQYRYASETQKAINFEFSSNEG